MQHLRSLIVTADPHLLEELLRLTAQAGVVPVVAPDPVAARPLWGGAPLVVVGPDQAEGCAGLPGRPRVVLVVESEPDDPLWELAQLLGAEHVAALPAAEPWLVERFGAAEQAAPVAPVIGVLGGRGGAGASVLAAGLAVTAARQGSNVLLVDADPLGGGVDLVLGWEEVGGLRWPELTSGELGSFPERGRLSVLSQDRQVAVEVSPELMAAALRTGQSAADLVVLDLPRTLDDAARHAMGHADRLLLVVPAELRACAAAAKVVAHLGAPEVPVEVVVRGPSPGKLRAAEIARALNLPLAGTLRSEPGLVTALEHGSAPAHTGRGPLAELCRRLLADPRLAGPAS
ncbi:septum site-determining protein Ssd [Longispora sp. K20-0274]|uniref:septum site-determining protein Ssd n=1 Tax=Longispora sp. K20-0274 TaxID=3088255 RepID=UPI00399A7027